MTRAQTPQGLGREALDESQRDQGGEAAEGEVRPGTARSCATALGRKRFSVQHSPGVVMRACMVRVGILRENNKLTGIVGPVAQRVKVERASERCGCRRSLDASQRIAVSHAPPSLHVGLHRSRHVPWDGTVHGNPVAKHPVGCWARSPPAKPTARRLYRIIGERSSAE